MPTTMKLIGKQTLGSAAASVTFSSIPGTYTDLVLLASIRSTHSSLVGVNISFNGTTTNYSRRLLYSNNTTALSYNDSARQISSAAGTNFTANTFSSMEMLIPNYAGSTNKSSSITTVVENNGTSWAGEATAFLWSNTAAITSIELSPSSANFAASSSFFLYGITSAAGSIPGVFGVDATGGDVTISGGFKYHVFRSSGQLTVAQPGWLEMLIVGGGGAGAEWGAGGGAGGFRLLSTQVSPGPLSVLVGAGGPTTAGYATVPAGGSNSSIGALTATGGGRAGSGGNSSGGAGGSGGGGWATGSGGSGVSGQGNAGGNSASSNTAGGGGGAGAVGGNSVGSISGSGGAGSSSASAWGAAVNAGQLSSGSYFFAGGGGGSGSTMDGTTRGVGGVGGGGDGQNGATAGTAGTANTGGGGGGGGRQSGTTYNGGAGGSGIVIIRYPVT
jgi:hypothetical protein